MILIVSYYEVSTMGREALIEGFNNLNLIERSRRLRTLVFDYLKGNLKETIPDGPAVMQLRDNLTAMNQLDYFIKTQSPDKVWATYLELTLLAELFQVNLKVLYKQHPGQSTFLNADVSEDKPTVTLSNDANTHWSAVVDGKEVPTPGDGNCGYHAFALSLAKPSNTVTEEIRQQTSYTPRTDERDQIETDYQYALSLALEDLPGAGGKGLVEIQQSVIDEQARLISDCQKDFAEPRRLGF